MHLGAADRRFRPTVPSPVHLQTQTRAYMLPQKLLAMVPQGVEVVAGQFSLRQGLKRGGEVMRALEAQQGLFEVAPTPDLRWRTAAGEQIKA